MLSYEALQAFLYAEARAQAEKRWADWLAFYGDDCSFFMPSWDDDDRLTTDPQNEVSLIYYPNKQGLEDRVFRIETERSSATTPDTRYNRSISNIEILAQDEKSMEVTSSSGTMSVVVESGWGICGRMCALKRSPSGMSTDEKDVAESALVRRVNLSNSTPP